ncbi:MAG: hypothetical protein V4498_03100 [candidate division FCPU426 bacterium]
MFNHPALLRQLNLCAEQLRRAGESDWSRRVLAAGDQVRRSGWTETGKVAVDLLFSADPGLDSVLFGAEHERRLGGPVGVADANGRMSELRDRLKQLAAYPLRQALAPGAPRQRSPDLG